MKKLFLTLVFIGITTSMFAYSSPGDEIGAAIINWAIVIMGILNIILLYKIWGMTNDVKELKNKICSEQIWLKKNLLQLKYTGKIEEAKTLLDKNFENEVFEKSLAFGVSSEKVKKDVETVIKKYEYYYKCLGCEMPNGIKDINTKDVMEDYSLLTRASIKYQAY